MTHLFPLGSHALHICKPSLWLGAGYEGPPRLCVERQGPLPRVNGEARALICHSPPRPASPGTHFPDGEPGPRSHTLKPVLHLLYCIFSGCPSRTPLHSSPAPLPEGLTSYCTGSLGPRLPAAAVQHKAEHCRFPLLGHMLPQT